MDAEQRRNEEGRAAGPDLQAELSEAVCLGGLERVRELLALGADPEGPFLHAPLRGRAAALDGLRLVDAALLFGTPEVCRTLLGLGHRPSAAAAEGIFDDELAALVEAAGVRDGLSAPRLCWKRPRSLRGSKRLVREFRWGPDGMAHRDAVALLSKASEPGFGRIPEVQALLDWASRHHVAELAFLLLALGADPNGPAEGYGDSGLLRRAVASGFDESGVLELLLAFGADPNAVNEEDGATPLLAALYDAEQDRAEAVEALLAAGADPNLALCDGATPLMLAARSAASVRALLERGADPNARDDEGWTPLHWAAMEDDVEAAGALFVAGAEPDARAADGSAPADHAQGLLKDLLVSWSENRAIYAMLSKALAGGASRRRI